MDVLSSALSRIFINFFLYGVDVIPCVPQLLIRPFTYLLLVVKNVQCLWLTSFRVANASDTSLLISAKGVQNDRHKDPWPCRRWGLLITSLIDKAFLSQSDIPSSISLLFDWFLRQPIEQGDYRLRQSSGMLSSVHSEFSSSYSLIGMFFIRRLTPCNK
ncbi:hypothetical protein AVEN_72678-1 [Araneus ventricosus]|uniref:Uncharacterized protein n=1 Tax=Araneus ventricosus TaxID=182803 RepID=A0A4Y2GCY9_ARAVE|nr:hypothetical protein AVEN_72678-1 [Araneus ventricosus]